MHGSLLASLEERLFEGRPVGKALFGVLGEGPIEEPVQPGGAAAEPAAERHLRVVGDGVNQ